MSEASREKISFVRSKYLEEDNQDLIARIEAIQQLSISDQIQIAYGP